MKKKIVHHLHRLRQKPEEERRNILYFLTVVFGIIIVLLWTLTLKGTVSSPEVKEKIKQDLTPFSFLKNDMVGSINNLKGQGLPSTQ